MQAARPRPVQTKPGGGDTPSECKDTLANQKPGERRTLPGKAQRYVELFLNITLENKANKTQESVIQCLTPSV